ncbi:hypothetical protein ABIB34_003677 [Rhodococcus sp. UYP5]
MTPRSQAVPAADAVRCRVLRPYLIFDQVTQRQVGPGSIVLVHPGTVRGWVRNGWIELADTDDDDAPVDTDQDAETVTKKPTAPRRRANRNAQAAE